MLVPGAADLFPPNFKKKPNFTKFAAEKTFFRVSLRVRLTSRRRRQPASLSLRPGELPSKTRRDTSSNLETAHATWAGETWRISRQSGPPRMAAVCQRNRGNRGPGRAGFLVQLGSCQYLCNLRRRLSRRALSHAGPGAAAAVTGPPQRE